MSLMVELPSVGLSAPNAGHEAWRGYQHAPGAALQVCLSPACCIAQHSKCGSLIMDIFCTGPMVQGSKLLVLSKLQTKYPGSCWSMWVRQKLHESRSSYLKWDGLACLQCKSLRSPLLWNSTITFFPLLLFPFKLLSSLFLFGKMLAKCCK